MSRMSDGREPKGWARAAATGFACCPPSEWHWFRWVLLAQPVIAVALLVLDRLELL